MKNGPLFIADEIIKPGEIKDIHLPISEAANTQPVYIPITVIKGLRPGPTVFLTAAVHGDELNGTAILRNLINITKPKSLCGALVVVPILNIFGFLLRSRYLPDRRDLNRSFPGHPTGNMAQRVAHRFFNEIIAKCDFGIDFHTATHGRENFPHVRADMDKPNVKKLAKAFGVSILVNNKGPEGSLRKAATEKNIPTIIFEAGNPNAFERDIVNFGLKKTRGFLSKMGVLRLKKKKRKNKPLQIIVRKTVWIRSSRGGLLENSIKPGQIVTVGMRLAKITNPFGKDVHQIISPLNGLVIGISSNPVVNPGTPIAHVVVLKKTLAKVRSHATNGHLTY